MNNSFNFINMLFKDYACTCLDILYMMLSVICPIFDADKKN